MDYVECPGTSDSIKISLFLAGGISGCRNWQQNIISKLSPLDIILYNPRRKDYDHKNPDIAQEQIEWEEKHIMKADVVAFFFCKETLCPVTLYELGVCNAVEGKKVVIGMDPEYQRRIDVEIQTKLKQPNTPIIYGLEEFGEILYKSLNLILALK